MVAVAQSQILGNILPRVFISKVILQTTGDEVVESNPHVDVAREPDVFIDPRTGRAKRRFVEPNFSNKSREAQELSITVECLLKEKITNDLFTSWFGNVDFTKFIRIKLFQITDGNLARILGNDASFLDALSPASFLTPQAKKIKKVSLARDLGFLDLNGTPRTFFETDPTRDPLYQPETNVSPRFREDLSLPQIDSLENLINPRFYQLIRDKNVVNSTEVPIEQETPRDPREIFRQFKETDAQGNEIYNFLFRRTFVVKNKNPQHLSYFAFAFLDLQQLAQEFDLGTNFPKSNTIGSVANEVVINNGEVVAQSAVFYNQNNEVWAGPVRRTIRGELVGVRKDGIQVPLRRELVPNGKVQDFRNFDDLEKVVVDFSFLENELGRINFINPRKEGFGVLNPSGYFSDLGFARDKDGSVRFFFSIDYKRMLQDNTNFGKVLNREEGLQNILDDSAILGIRVFRRRIQGSPEIGSAQRENDFFITNPVGYGQNFIDKTIAVSGEKVFESIKDADQQNGSLVEIRNVDLNDVRRGEVRHFAGTDRSIRRETDGYYRYGVELEIRDAGYTFLKNYVRELEKVRQRLASYFAEATSLAASRNQVPIMSPHVDVPYENFIEKGEVKKGNYDPMLNRFSQRFIEEQKNKHYNSTNNISPWGEAVQVYVEGLKIFSDTPVDYARITQQLLYFTNPTTGSPAGIDKFLKLIENLQRNIEQEIGITAYGRGESGESLDNVSSVKKDSGVSKSKISKATSQKKSFSISYLFKDVYNSNLQPEVGFDFLDVLSVEDKQLGLRVISSEDYERRTQREIDTYFNTQRLGTGSIDITYNGQSYSQGDSVETTRYSFLSPAVVMTGKDQSFTRIGSSPVPNIPLVDFQQTSFKIKKFKTPTFNVAPTLKVSNPQISLKKELSAFVPDLGFVAEPVIRKVSNLVPVTEKPTSNIPERTKQELDRLPEKAKRECSFEEDEIDDPNFDPTQLLLSLVEKTKLYTIADPNDLASIQPSKGTTGPTIQATNVSSEITARDFGGPTISVDETSKELAFVNKNFVPSIQFFDLASKENTLNKLVQKPSLINAEQHFQGLFHTTTLNDAVKVLPNQIKSLFLQRTKPEITRANWLNAEVDPYKVSGVDVELKFNYNLLQVVQVLRGFEKDKDGKTLIRSPIWEPLTAEVFNDARGEALICRLKPYENVVLGVTRARDFELPPFDKFFILRPRLQPEPLRVSEENRRLLNNQNELNATIDASRGQENVVRASVRDPQRRANELRVIANEDRRLFDVRADYTIASFGDLF